MQNFVEKWKATGAQGLYPVEKTVEMWITPCRYFYLKELCSHFLTNCVEEKASFSFPIFSVSPENQEKSHPCQQAGLSGSEENSASFPPPLKAEYGPYMEQMSNTFQIKVCIIVAGKGDWDKDLLTPRAGRGNILYQSEYRVEREK